MPFSGIDSLTRYNKPERQRPISYNRFSSVPQKIFFESTPVLIVETSGNYLIVKLLNLKLNHGSIQYVYFYLSGNIITNSSISNYKPIGFSFVSGNALEYKADLTSMDVSIDDVYIGVMFADGNGNYIKDGTLPYILQTNYKQNTVIVPQVTPSTNYISNINIVPNNNIYYDKETSRLVGSIEFDISYLGGIIPKYVFVDIADKIDYTEKSLYSDFNWLNIFSGELSSESSSCKITLNNIPVSVMRFYHSFRFRFYDENKNIVAITPFDKKRTGEVNEDSLITMPSDFMQANNGLSYSVFLSNNVPVDNNVVLYNSDIIFSHGLSLDFSGKCYFVYTGDNSYYIINHEFYNSSIYDISMRIDSNVNTVCFGKSLASNINMFPSNNIYNIENDIEFIPNSGIKVITQLSYDVNAIPDISVILKTSLNTYCITRHFYINSDGSPMYGFVLYINGAVKYYAAHTEYDYHSDFPFVINEDDMYIYAPSDPSEIYQYLFVHPDIIDLNKVKEYTYYKSFDINTDNKVTAGISNFSNSNISTITDSEISDDLKSMLKSKQQLQTLTQYTDE